MDYKKQAEDFLKDTGATIEARWLRCASHFGEKDESRDIYEIRLRRGSREYVFTFGASIVDTETRIQKAFTEENAARIRKDYEHKLFTPYALQVVRKKNQEAELKEWKPAGTTYRPSAYDILAGLTKNEPADNIDDFAEEYGYTKPSEAIRAYEGVKEEWEAVNRLFTDAEILKLQEIA